MHALGSFKHRRGTSRFVWIVRGLVASCMMIGASAAQASDCKLACRASDSCRMTGAQREQTIERDRFKLFKSCEDLNISGPAEVRYMQGRAWFVPSPTLLESMNGSVKKLFDAYPPDMPCSVPTAQCVQSQMSRMTTAFAGSPIDDRVSQPGGQGEPCSLGFPCGRVALPSKSWRFQLSDPSLSGKWIVKLARGNVAEGRADQTVARVERGVVIADGGWFAAGSKCSYAFIDNSGRTVATGEFALVSRATQENLRELARRRVAAGSSDAIAWTDTLMSNDFQWDAVQESLSDGRRP